jgi:hypothetical protein
MASGDVKNAYSASSALTITLASLATSAGGVAGRASSVVDNTTNLYQDYLLSGGISVGTTPTANTVIEVWAIPVLDDTPTWPDTFTGGGDAAVTVTSRGVLFGFGKLVSSLQVDAATSNVKYPFEGSVRAAFGGSLPKKFLIWVVNISGVALNATGGNHVVTITGVYSNVSP